MRTDVQRNVFDSDWAAARYAQGRPDVHTQIVNRIRERLRLAPAGLLDLAVDLGCGTGMSTRSLRSIARHCIGVDPSTAMLSQAKRSGGASFIRAAAESLPLQSGCADLATICQAYHWCDAEALLKEAARILVPSGWLVVYDSFFSPHEGALAELHDWLISELWRDYPIPERGALPDPERFSHAAFALAQAEDFEQSIPMDRDRLAAFLLTQSRLLAAVAWAGARFDDLEAALRRRLSALVGSSAIEVPFTGPIYFFRKRLGD